MCGTNILLSIQILCCQSSTSDKLWPQEQPTIQLLIVNSSDALILHVNIHTLASHLFSNLLSTALLHALPNRLLLFDCSIRVYLPCVSALVIVLLEYRLADTQIITVDTITRNCCYYIANRQWMINYCMTSRANTYAQQQYVYTYKLNNINTYILGVMVTYQVIHIPGNDYILSNINTYIPGVTVTH